MYGSRLDVHGSAISQDVSELTRCDRRFNTNTTLDKLSGAKHEREVSVVL